MDAHAYIIAGPNGAGKTTFAKDYLPKFAHCREFLNADLVAAGISPFDPDAAALAAGRTLLARMRELIRQGKDFGFETTLAGRSYRAVLDNMKRKGYRLHLFYLWLPDADLAIARVAHRVKQGGHNIPEIVIRRRFELGARNLVSLYLRLFDSWMLFDNTSMRPNTIARHVAGETEVMDDELYRQIVNTPRQRGGRR
jgi:predicted ABC-type ATPase